MQPLLQVVNWNWLVTGANAGSVFKYKWHESLFMVIPRTGEPPLKASSRLPVQYQDYEYGLLTRRTECALDLDPDKLFLCQSKLDLKIHQPKRLTYNLYKLLAIHQFAGFTIDSRLIQQQDGNIRWRLSGARNSLDSVLIRPNLGICFARAVVKRRSLSLAKQA